MQKILKNKKGSISLFVLLSALFFLVVVTAVAVSLKNKEASVDSQIEKVKANYEKDVGNEDAVYNEALSETVIFDANGGTVSTTSKVVKLGETYGELPTPTRDGYTFKGWNGKNLFNIESILTDAYISTSGVETPYHDTTPWSCSDYIEVKGGNTYTFNPNSTKGNGMSSHSIYDSEKNFIKSFETGLQTMIMPQNAKYVRVSFRSTTSSTKPSSNLQLEEGTTATEFEPYYVTSSTTVTQDKDHTLTAIWEKAEATFLKGQEFNVKIKQLVNGTENTSTDVYGFIIDERVTSIKRANTLANLQITNDNIVSTADSTVPIYMWFDNGTLYYYTEAENPKLNSEATSMFRQFSKVESIDLETIDTSETIKMNCLFTDCNSLKNIDLSKFNTINVTDTSSMFYRCNSLEVIDVSSFNTSKVIYMNDMFSMWNANSNSVLREIKGLEEFNTSNVQNAHAMFYGCKNLQKLDLSNFNMANVTNCNDMFTNMSILTELKTPKNYPSNTSLTMTLPKTLYDSNNNAYTSLTSTSPKQTLLKQSWE